MLTATNEISNPASTLGSKIRSLRLRLKRTLEETATGAGISKPFLSQVERGLASPSITSLTGIANALGVTVRYFVERPSEERSVCRGDQVSFFGFADSANRFARLTNLRGGCQLDPILVKMPPGQKRTEVATHASEECLYVIAGEVLLTLEGETFVLKAGDSAHYESKVPHSWENTAQIESVFLWVGTPRLL
ncbi:MULTISPECIES: helix-turn-helix domain-containing protein [Paraburkholderia]|jgi:transcriptional regulator with XRE-family HTH domain|uniref:helix-turn-helix domain-containing protein n=1 Tax=Paraburkholderia TaxID=1822464 RepID=UPI00190A2B88|nr:MULTISPECIES: cupin domain-containing protein [Paraburkholderia]MCP2088249.1 transcriptional regulator with XRE-family HTH domain [Paraburkholderia sediminicola]MBK3840874.1 cupin domain-containing protein [Paraburkholderia aspalathi]MCX4139605.1 cupin domain-containing protein [Paraburkholderia aspalathi]MCX4155365.1 cupin domain-containing protein [Paraburkholderia aspalathi]MDN7164775.1 cupin domain-containing protein [Paraburkholderia sp. SECH2]